MNKITCYLTEKKTGDKYPYAEPIYTKLDGMWGYLCVSVMNVHFIWTNYLHDGQTDVCCDDVSEDFSVDYLIQSENLEK